MALPERSRDAEAQFHAAAGECVPALYRRALGLTRNPADAHDLVQDTLERGFRSLHRFEGGTNMRVWLLRILVNLFIDGCRRNARAPRLEVLDEETAGPAAEPGGDDEVPWASISSEQFQAALGGLDPVFRSVYELRIAGHLKYDQIARELDIPMGTVATRLARARQKLRQMLVPDAGAREDLP